jgi:sorbose reductase
MAEVTDLQGAIVYLAAEVSDFMTGHDMIIDGGYSVW